MLHNARIPIIGVVAYSGTGKTTLLVKLLERFKQRGYRVAVVKHAHHKFDIDVPGKDSYELRKAGASQMLVGSSRRWALVAETGGTEEPRLDDLLRHLDQDALDFILVEGFKTETFPKIELHRPGLGHPVLCVNDDSFVAIATDATLPVEPRRPVLNLNRADEIAAFILGYLFPAKPAGASSGGQSNS